MLNQESWRKLSQMGRDEVDNSSVGLVLRESVAKDTQPSMTLTSDETCTAAFIV